jgi:hypothetical protein
VTNLCLIEAPGMPGGPTIKIMWLGELYREVKGLESLGVSIARARAGPWSSWDAGNLESFRLAPAAGQLPSFPGFQRPKLTIQKG